MSEDRRSIKVFMSKGQIQLGLASGMAIISFVAGPLIGYFSAQMATQKDISQLSERAAKLETSVPRIEQDISDIKMSLKNIEKSLNQR